jgi:hypothetical protein
LYLHYLRNFPETDIKFHIICSLLSKEKPLKSDSGENMLWKSNLIDSSKFVTQNTNGRKVMRDINASNEINNAQTIIPVMDDCIWIKDLYSYIWKDLANNDILLAFEFVNDDEVEPFAIASMKLSSKNGTIKYGAYDLPVHNSKYHQSPNRGYDPDVFNLVFIIDNPKQEALRPKPAKDRKNKKVPPIDFSKIVN